MPLILFFDPLSSLSLSLLVGMIFVFLNDYFSQDRGMSVEAATGALVLFGVGGFIGQAAGKYNLTNILGTM